MSDNCANSFETDYSTRSVPLNEIEASLRLPMLHGLVAAMIWLTVGTVFHLISVSQLLSPGWFADCVWLTHGKASVVADSALLYGFGIQMVTTLGLYISCRMSRKALRHPFSYLVAGKFWNLGVLIGVVGIFAGDASGFEFLALPVYSSAVLFLSFLVMSLKNLLVIHYRSEREFYPAQLFQAAGMFWFLWVLATAIVVLQLQPVSGVAQFVVNKWYVNGVFQLVLGAGGVALLTYFVPQIAQRPLYSRELAVTTFWTLLFVAGWTGLSGRWPLPAWMSGVSGCAAFLLAVPLATFVWNTWRTLIPDLSKVVSNPVGSLLIVGTLSYALWLTSEMFLGFAGVSDLLRETHFESAREALLLYGFVGSTAFGVMMLVVPRLTGVDWSVGSSRLIFQTTLAGLVLNVGGSAIAGLKQGIALSDSSLSFKAVSESGLGFLELARIGEIGLLIAGGITSVELLRMIGRSFYAENPVLDWMSDESTATADKEAV
jgi:cytochrome c oxidase cbb3-type subunit 1